MLFAKLKVLRSHGRQYIKHLERVELPDSFRGRPVLAAGIDRRRATGIANICPTGAFRAEPFSIDLGRCAFCGECARMAPEHIRFTNDYRLGTNVRENLVIKPDSPDAVIFDPELVRDCITSVFSRSLRLREVSAGGDNSTEMELNATMNVNFDFARYGVEFVASPRHADGLVVTGPLTAGMSRALDICYCSVAEPKIIIMAGCDAVSGGVFADSPAVDRAFLERYSPDLWLPGNPVHPMTFIEGVLTLLKHGHR